MPLTRKLAAEFIGTFWLVLGGCGSAVLSAAFPHVGIGLLGVSLAFGLTIVAMAYTIGDVSGCHLNPAVTFGLVLGGRSDPLAGGLAANGFGDHSPGHYSMAAGLVCELIMTAIFLFVIMGATDKKAPTGFAPLAIGLTLTLIHLISIPVTNTSVNPARSTGPAVFVQGWALSQLWLFWLAPLLGGAIGALVYRFITPGKGVTEPGY
jgi:aquaporin Z